MGFDGESPQDQRQTSACRRDFTIYVNRFRRVAAPAASGRRSKKRKKSVCKESACSPLARAPPRSVTCWSPHAFPFNACALRLVARMGGSPSLRDRSLATRALRTYLRVPFLGTGLELERSEHILALLVVSGVPKSIQIRPTPTQSLGKVPTSIPARRTRSDRGDRRGSRSGSSGQS